MCRQAEKLMRQGLQSVPRGVLCSRSTARSCILPMNFQEMPYKQASMSGNYTHGFVSMSLSSLLYEVQFYSFSGKVNLEHLELGTMLLVTCGDEMLKPLAKDFL